MLRLILKTKNWNFELEKYKVYVRPGLNKFLNELKQNFRVAVWSSASDDYVKKVVEKIFPDDYNLEFVLGADLCVRYNMILNP